ncbi:MAG: hypothetical protein EOP09_10690, partial [Proteobacteria bacterium]
MGRAETIRHLRLLPGLNEAQTKEFWQAPAFASGVAKGIVVELLGNARTEWLLKLFHAYPQHYIYWCEREPSINPVAISQRGIDLSRIKFVNSTSNLQQPIRLALESGHYPFVVAPTGFDEVRIFQRFQLLAEKSKSTLFLLGENKFTDAWPIA